MTMIFCPGCNHKMLPYEFSCPICGYTDTYPNGGGDFLGGIEEEFGYDGETFYEDDF
ncbi:hypothetical protein ACFL0O_03660 [Thermodesulfobacteriota bacterium]